MFGKLLKHEWKATAPLLLFLSGCIIAVSFLTVVFLRLYIDNLDSDIIFTIFILIMLFALLCVTVYMLATNVILLLQFYRSRFSNQGYLTFTLPVKPSQIFLVSTLHIYLWNIIAYLVIAAAFFIVWLLGVPWNKITITDRWEIISEFVQMYSLFGRAEGMSWLVRLLNFFYMPIAYMTAIVVSCSFVKQHKGLVAIALMLVTQIPERVYAFLIGFWNGLFLPSAVQDTAPSILPPLVFCVILTTLTVGCYSLSVHLMEKKLNLA